MWWVGGGGAQYVNCLYQESKFKNNFVCVWGGGGDGGGRARESEIF